MNVWTELTTALRTLPHTGPPAEAGTLIALSNVWKEHHALPFVEEMIQQAEKKGELNPYHRKKTAWVRKSRLYFLSRALGDAWDMPIDWSLETSKLLTEEHAQVILKWLKGHNPHHWRDGEEQVEEALVQHRRYTWAMLYMAEYVLLDMLEEDRAVQRSREAVAGRRRSHQRVTPVPGCVLPVGPGGVRVHGSAPEHVVQCPEEVSACCTPSPKQRP